MSFPQQPLELLKFGWHFDDSDRKVKLRYSTPEGVCYDDVADIVGISSDGQISAKLHGNPRPYVTSYFFEAIKFLDRASNVLLMAEWEETIMKLAPPPEGTKSLQGGARRKSFSVEDSRKSGKQKKRESRHWRRREREVGGGGGNLLPLSAREAETVRKIEYEFFRDNIWPLEECEKLHFFMFCKLLYLHDQFRLGMETLHLDLSMLRLKRATLSDEPICDRMASLTALSKKHRAHMNELHMLQMRIMLRRGVERRSRGWPCIYSAPVECVYRYDDPFGHLWTPG